MRRQGNKCVGLCVYVGGWGGCLDTVIVIFFGNFLKHFKNFNFLTSFHLKKWEYVTRSKVSILQNSFICFQIVFKTVGTNSGYCFCEGLHKVLHQLAEPAAPQHEPHGQQALQLWCLWQKLLPGSHPEETPTHSHIDTTSPQAWPQTGTSSTI